MGVQVGNVTARKAIQISALDWVSATNPSAELVSQKPTYVCANSADAGTSAEFSDVALALTCVGPAGARGTDLTLYLVQRRTPYKLASVHHGGPMPQPLVDLLWRDHPQAPQGGSRGPRARVSTTDVVQAAIRLADADGLAAVRIRDLAASLGVSTMAIYTHVNSRADLLVLMVDAVHASMTRPVFGRAGWRTRVRRLADANLELLRTHPWLLDVSDDRVVFGPGTIAKYDHELHAFDGMGLDDATRDAALTFVLDFVRASARALLPAPNGVDTVELWRQWRDRLAEYVGDAYPLARRVGAGAAMTTAYDPRRAYEFGLNRVLAALADLSRTTTSP